MPSTLGSRRRPGIAAAADLTQPLALAPRIPQPLPRRCLASPAFLPRTCASVATGAPPRGNPRASSPPHALEGKPVPPRSTVPAGLAPPGPGAKTRSPPIAAAVIASRSFEPRKPAGAELLTIPTRPPVRNYQRARTRAWPDPSPVARWFRIIIRPTGVARSQERRVPTSARSFLPKGPPSRFTLPGASFPTCSSPALFLPFSVYDPSPLLPRGSQRPFRSATAICFGRFNWRPHTSTRLAPVACPLPPVRDRKPAPLSSRRLGTLPASFRRDHHATNFQTLNHEIARSHRRREQSPLASPRRNLARDHLPPWRPTSSCQRSTPSSPPTSSPSGRSTTARSRTSRARARASRTAAASRR